MTIGSMLSFSSISRTLGATTSVAKRFTRDMSATQGDATKCVACTGLPQHLFLFSKVIQRIQGAGMCKVRRRRRESSGVPFIR